ncbi:MAG: chromate transporter [Pedobacter sp.]|nr:MAG: chromate transporter [Pedobacter sp.]
MQVLNNINIAAESKVSLSYLFQTFFKIGLVSFGGHMALLAVVQREMVDKDKTLDNDVVLDAISIASLLPGPLAVNVVAYIGYYLKGKKGAIIASGTNNNDEPSFAIKDIVVDGIVNVTLKANDGFVMVFN